MDVPATALDARRDAPPPVRGTRRAGRPRAAPLPASGLSPREELLAAAAELFTRHGYAATTTRAVAERAGMRQATMYHYVGGKQDLLAELLEGTVTPSLALAGRLLGDAAQVPAEARLWYLCRSDVTLLCAGPHNLGALYLLPEVRGERFTGFHEARHRLKDAYAQLLASTGVCEASGDPHSPDAHSLRTDLVFGLIEGVILVHRSAPTRRVETFASAAADAALRVAGVPDDALPAVREAAAELAGLAELAELA